MFLKQKHKKITFVTANNENIGSARLRVYKIAKELINRGYDVSVNKNYEQADILIFQKSHYDFLEEKFFKYLLSNKFIVFDVDDLYLGKFLNLVKYSDLIISGSDYLADCYKQYNPNVIVLDDVVDVVDINIPLKTNCNLKEPKIGWFGNVSNLPVLEKLKIKNVKTITSNGDIEWSIDTVDYNIQKFDLIVIPQEKTPVGLSKCNCRMLKALYLGVPALVSDIPPYLELMELVGYPKEFIVKDGEDWNEKIEKIKSGEIKFDFDFVKCRKILLDNYSIQKRTDLWLDIVFGAYKENNLLRHIRKIITDKKFTVFKRGFSKIFSIKNNTSGNIKRKIITILGIKIKFKIG